MFLAIEVIGPGTVNISFIGKYENDVMLGHLKLDYKVLRPEVFNSSRTLEPASRYFKEILISLVWSRVGHQYFLKNSF